MAELLVRVVDKTNPDPLLDCKLTKRGMVIAVQPDGWQWGFEELANPDWRIIRVPGVDPSQFGGLLAPEPEIDPQNPSRVLQRRAFRLNLDDSRLDDAGFRTDLSDFAQITITQADALVTVNGRQALEVAKLSALNKSRVGALATTLIYVPPTMRRRVSFTPLRALVDSITVALPRLSDPSVIGESGTVIG